MRRWIVLTGALAAIAGLAYHNNPSATTVIGLLLLIVGVWILAGYGIVWLWSSAARRHEDDPGAEESTVDDGPPPIGVPHAATCPPGCPCQRIRQLLDAYDFTRPPWVILRHPRAGAR